MSKLKSMILKVQRPLATNDADAPWLFYDEIRYNFLAIADHRIPKALKDLMGDSFKCYISIKPEDYDDFFETLENAVKLPDYGW